MKRLHYLLTAVLLLAANAAEAQKTVRYDLYVTDTMVNYTGKTKMGYAVNGQIPMPTLTFTEGDTALIYVHNQLKHDQTSLHWHGLILPNRYDGVPWLTTAPINAGETHEYRFPIVQSGTYWYHSHTGHQQQNGMHGAFIIHKRQEPPIKEYTLILSDWTDMHPGNVHRRLHNADDWFAIQKRGLQKGATQSYAEAIRAGHLSTKLTNEWKRMTAMDVSDVYYDRFLSNGRPEIQAPQFKGGETIKLHVINGSATTYFWLQFAGGRLTVTASDGMDVTPVPVDRMIIGTAETYDIEVTLPADSTAYEFTATAEDRTRSTSLWLGSGIKQLALPLQPLKYFEGMKMMNDMMKMNGTLDDMGMNMSLQQMDMNVVMYPEITGSGKKNAHTPESHAGTHTSDNRYNSNALSSMVTLNYSMLRAPQKTTLPAAPFKELKFELTGNMNRYTWTINNKTVSETDKIMIKKGENVRLILYNNSMMRHPMHLHGHFFRIVNGQGDYAPLKNVLDIMPMETDTLEFAGTEDGDWFFHCHILYHMMSGMGRIFSYENSTPNPELPDTRKAWKQFLKEDKGLHFMAQNDFASNGNDGEAMLQNTRWKLQTEWRLGYNDMHGYETEVHLGRYLDRMQWLFPYIGFDWRYRKMEEDEMEKNIFGQANTKDQRAAVCFGLQYTLPWLLVADGRIDTDGRLRMQLMREDIPVSSRLRFNFMVNSDKEYMAGFRYVTTKFLSLSTHYDSDMGWGAGITLNY